MICRVVVIGLTDDNPYFPPIVSEHRNAVSISSSTASKFGLKPGDELILHNRVEDAAYGLRCRKLCRTRSASAALWTSAACAACLVRTVIITMRCTPITNWTYRAAGL